MRWGILGTGSIAGSMAQALHEVPDADLLAVGSRSQASAERFGDRWKIPRRHGGFAELAHDPDIDVVYIATPHSVHADNVQLCLNAGKHVLCEKPFTLNAAQAAACIALARERGLFLMEAVWMRFFPAIHQVRDWVGSGAIGDVRHVQAEFSIHVPFDPSHRLYDPALGGGALLDLGIYPLSLATMLLGLPSQIDGEATLGETGVDEHNVLRLTYEGGATALLSSGLHQHTPHEATVEGTEGTIRIHDAFFHPDRLTLHRHGRAPETHHLPYLGNGYPHEVQAVHDALRAGLLECPQMPLDETLAVMGLMDGLRARFGVRYAADGVGS